MKIYNTLTKQLEEFEVTDNIVNMYVCGITPYSSSHLGHAMCAIVFDVIRRYMEYKGFKVSEVGIHTYPRTFGTGSSVSFKNILLTIKEMLELFFKIKI